MEPPENFQDSTLGRNSSRLLSFSLFLISWASLSAAAAPAPAHGITVIPSYHNDVSAPLHEMPARPTQVEAEHEAAENPFIPTAHVDTIDLLAHQGTLLAQLAPSIASPILSFQGISFPGVGCNCAPPDTNGEVGATQYVQMVNAGYQVFSKSTGTSLLGPNSITSLWSGFGGACENGGAGDPIVLYDQLANRWVITQFASNTGGTPITDECVAVSTSADATGSWNRYGFHLGSQFYDYPHLGVWPDAYYMSMNVFNAGGTAYLGPQGFAFDRAKMIAGQPATVVAGPLLGNTFPPMLPADLDGSTLPPSGAPNSFVLWPDTNTYRVYHFHVDFTTPSLSTFTLFASPAAAGFTQICPGTRACVPQAGVPASSYLDAIGDRLMFRLAYRNFGTHESLIGNYTVSSNSVAGIRWFELRAVTSGPLTKYQESTFQPDTTWRWLGSIAMDGQGNLALGYNASSSSINPQIRYTGRLASDPLNTLLLGETHLIDGSGSQTGASNRWGDYSDLTVDPVDDQTFWFTSEYYDSTSSINWRTRIGSFTLATGSLQVSIEPPAAIAQGAKWRVDNGTPQDSGTTLSGLATGDHVVSFKAVAGYFAPGDQSVTVISGQTATTTGTYVVTSQAGSLSVTIQPPGAVTAGAQWSVDSSTYKNSGTTVSGLSPGTHTVAFKPIPQYTAPANQSVTINSTQTTTTTGTYAAATPTPTPTPAPTATPTPAPTPTATPSPTPSPTPTPTPRPYTVQLGNISTRLSVGGGDNVLIGGFIITGNAPKEVILRVTGPSLPLPGALPNPVLELHGASGDLIAQNDDWKDSSDQKAISDSGFAPRNSKESAIIRALAPGLYTAIAKSANTSSGIGLVEIYDLNQTAESKLSNISTRGLVGIGDNVMIGGLIVLGDESTQTLIRALGPSLPLTGTLSDPVLELYDGNGTLLDSNDDWRSDQEREISATGIAPKDNAESAIVATLAPGSYTAIVRGFNSTTGVALVEAYQLDN